jgi:hypothetical protein
MTEKTSKPLDLEEGPTKYIDRPTNDGKHGDAADEPNEREPSTPGRPGGASRQQRRPSKEGTTPAGAK